MIKSFVEPKEAISIEDCNREVDDAVKRVAAGAFYGQAAVEAMAKNW